MLAIIVIILYEYMVVCNNSNLNNQLPIIVNKKFRNLEERDPHLDLLSSTGVVYRDTNGKPLFTTQLERVYHNLYIHIHTNSKSMHTYVYIHTKRNRVRTDLLTSKCCETQMRSIQMIFDKYAI